MGPSLTLALITSSFGAELLRRPIEDPTAPRRVAVVVGLDGAIGGAGTLTAAERDARALAEVLSEGGFSLVVLLTGEEVTRESVLGAISGLSAQGLGEDDTALVHVVTHGALCPTSDEPRAHHLRVTETAEGARCWTNSLRDDQLLSALAATGAGNRVLGIDACMTAYGAAGAADLSGPDPLRRVVEQEILLRSASAGRAAYEVDGAVLYTHALTEALRGAGDTNADGAVTAREAHDYATRSLKSLPLDVAPTWRQVAIGDTEVVVLTGEAGAPTAPALEHLPTRWDWQLDGQPVPLGSEGILPVTGEIFERRDALGVGLRVRRLPSQPGYTDGRAFIAGRQRGAPSLVLGAEAAAWPRLDTRLLAPAPSLGLTLRLHQQLLPNLALNAELSGRPLAWSGGVGLAGELHWWRLSPSLGVRVGRMQALETPEAAAAIKPTGPFLGGEVGLRFGLWGPFALAGSGRADLGATVYDDEDPRTLLRSSGTLGLLVDPGAL